MILYRPVGLHELKLIYESGLKTFPPRLPEQPIFYPVLNLLYAQQIAFDWNTKSEPFAGFVTQFAVDDQYGNQFERHIVGARQHEELWVPAEDLEEFNHHIVEKIEIVDARFGEKYEGAIGESASLKEKNAVEQFVDMAKYCDSSRNDVHLDILTNKTAIFLNYPFWQQYDFSYNGIDEGQRQKTLEVIQKSWTNSFPEIPLGIV
jgi:hypothetical protein